VKQNVLTLQQVITNPFSAYLIVDDDEILYYTQSFKELSGLNPSQFSPRLSTLNYRNLNFTLLEDTHSMYNVYNCSGSSSYALPYQQVWVEDLIHELRTASLIMGLGTHLLKETTSAYLSHLFKTLNRAAHRQKLSTLIASDIIQLITYPPQLKATELSRVISQGWNSLVDPSKVKFHINSGSGFQKMFFDPNPIIIGNEYFLTNFFSTTLSWFENQPVTIEMEQINRVSVRISFCIPYDKYLSSLFSYRLINHYFQYIAAYFNLRLYLTQSTLNIIFPINS